ncbi:MAG: ribosome silencing factor [Candidatus Wallbacteria bacterium]|nr:ribosome silencing factor [Candidatus Wallbacteria bacterium]
MNRTGWITGLLEEKKGEDIVVLTVKSNILVDEFVIATARSKSHLTALAVFVEQSAKEIGLRTKTDGGPDSEWVVLDFGDVLLHLFTDKMRRMYNLEKLFDEFNGGTVNGE